MQLSKYLINYISCFCEPAVYIIDVIFNCGYEGGLNASEPEPVNEQ